MNNKKVKKIVQGILIKYPESRNSDDILWLYVCKECNQDATLKPFDEVLRSMEILSLPKYASVSRARRKVVKEFPELRGDSNVEAGRELEEENYRFFYGRGF